MTGIKVAVFFSYCNVKNLNTLLKKMFKLLLVQRNGFGIIEMIIYSYLLLNFNEVMLSVRYEEQAYEKNIYCM